MQVEVYEPTRRDTLRAEAYFSTPAGKLEQEKIHESCMRYIDWRVKNEGFVPSPPTMKQYEEWLNKKHWKRRRK